MTSDVAWTYEPVADRGDGLEYLGEQMVRIGVFAPIWLLIGWKPRQVGSLVIWMITMVLLISVWYLTIGASLILLGAPLSLIGELYNECV